jgi:hypothetical protein
MSFFINQEVMMIKGILAAIVLPVVLVGAICMNASGEGIYDVGPTKNAIYLAGEACVINMTLDIPGKDMQESFEKCMLLHSAYLLEQDYPHFKW